jgi:PST family polysaccharide transporter
MRPFDADGKIVALPFVEESGELRKLTVRGVGATLFAGMSTLAIQVAATITLARILTPKDFGLIAMVTTFSLLLVNFGFNGFTEAVVQRDEMNEPLASTIFWINLGFGVVLTSIFAASGSLLARFFHDAEVQRVTEFVSLTIVATSVSTVHLALLKRAMRFSAVSANDIIARFISVLLSIGLGLNGWGYWALAVGAIAQPISTTIGAFWLCRWMPKRPRWVSGTKESLNFALHTYGNFGVNYLSRNTDNLLVGWRFNAQSLGYYKKAYDLFALTANQFVASLAIVIVSGLSRVVKSPALYRRNLLSAISVMALVGMGMGAGLTLMGRDLILVLLGPRWEPAGRIFQYFGPGIGVMVLYNTHSWIHLSIGRPDRWFRWAILEFGVTFSLFLVGLQRGPEGIAMAWSASFWLLVVPAIRYAGAPIDLKVSSVISETWRFVCSSIIAVVAIYLVERTIPSLAHIPGTHGALFRILIDILLLVPIYLGAVIVLHGNLGPLYRFMTVFRDMMPSSHEGDPNSERKFPEIEVSCAPFPLRALAQELPLVSVLIPAYNAEKWIDATIRSVLSQTWPNKEIIVVDDGSNDRTLEIARSFEAQGVKVVVQRNQGASAARNHAFSLSKGDYIQWLDADDLLAPDKIEKQMQLVMQGLSKRTLLSSPWAHFMYRPHAARFEPSPLWCDLSPQQWLMRKMQFNVFMQTSTWLVSREITQAAGPWDIRLLGDDDGEYFCRVLLASDGVRFVQDARVYYRAFRFDGLSYVGRFPQKIEAHWVSMKLHIKYLRSFGDTPEVRSSCLMFLRDSLIYFYPEHTHIIAEARELAMELGEPLGSPVLSWKYGWLERLAGWSMVKPAQRLLRLIRWRTTRRVDYVLYRIESGVSSSSDISEAEGGTMIGNGAAVSPGVTGTPGG